MTLYELTAEFQELLNMMEDPEIDDQVLADTLAAVAGEIEAKAEGYAAVITILEGDVTAIKAEEHRLSERRRIFENRIARMKDTVKAAMLLANKPKIESPLFTLTVRKTAPSLVIDDEGAIPECYWKQADPTIDKVALKADIKAGLECGYAHLESGQTLNIK